MPLEIDWLRWLPILTIASTLFAMAAGTLAVFQHLHTKDGRLTRFGYILVLLILVSGATALGLGIVDRRIAAEKEQADAAERDRQFQSQMGALRSVTGSLSQLQTDMRGSLGQQQRQFAVANRTLGMSEALQRQAQANTLNVLRSLFTESNRVSAERVAISVVFDCHQPDEDTEVPQLNQAVLVIEHRPREGVSLASDQKLENGITFIFHGFLGDLGPYESFDAWRQATISIILSARTRRSAADGYRIDQILRMDELRRQRGGRDARPAECMMTVGLLLNGRQVLVRRQPLVYLRDGQYLGILSRLRVDPRRLPRFAG